MSTRVTRSSVLGKRTQPREPSLSRCEQQLITPESTPNPKRPRVSLTAIDGDWNKENIPPLYGDIGNGSPTSPRATRALRRTSTEAVVATSPRPGSSVRRHASASLVVPATPVNDISHLSITTPPPTPPTSLLPIHSRARALLRATCNATTQIAGRDKERKVIQDFIIQDTSDYQSLYISGSPGTGKTALVNTILRELADNSNIAKVFSINCMALNGIDALWDRLAEELDSSKRTGKSKKGKGRETIETLLSTMTTKCILLLDELDHIASTSTALTTVFSLPVSSAGQLRLIGIANTHTLTSHLPSSAIQTLHFAPYTSPQLLDILNTRLGPLSRDASAEKTKFLPTPTLTLLSKKIATMTGDVRSLFEVLRGAIDLAVAPASSTTSEENPLNPPPPSVTPSHVLSALKAYSPAKSTAPLAGYATSTSLTAGNSEVVAKVRNLGLQPRLVLLSFLLASKRLEAGLPLSANLQSTSSLSSSPTKSPSKRSHSLPGTLSGSVSSAGIDLSVLHSFYSHVLTRGEGGLFTPVSRSEFGDLAGMLDVVGLVRLTSSSTPLSASPSKARRGFGRSASFGGLRKDKAAGGEVCLVEGVRCDEVLRGMGVEKNADSMDLGDEIDPKEEEVKIIWERECKRLKKDIDAAERAKSRSMKGEDVFVDAMEA